MARMSRRREHPHQLLQAFLAGQARAWHFLLAKPGRGVRIGDRAVRKAQFALDKLLISGHSHRLPD